MGTQRDDLRVLPLKRPTSWWRYVTLLRGLALLLLSGAVFGLTVPLSTLAAGAEQHPIGLALWVNFFCTVIALPWLLRRRSRPRWSWPVLRFGFFWGLAGAVAEITLFKVAQHVPASIVSIVLVLEGLFVFAVAAASGLEKATAGRFAGLCCGMLGVVLLVGFNLESGTIHSLWWPLIALSIPALYALEDFLIVQHMPANLDLVAGVGLAAGTSVLYLAPLAWLSGDLVRLDVTAGPLETALILIAGVTVLGSVLLARLLKSTGAVFGSQSGYAITLAGVLWSMLLLGEQVSVASVFALLLMIAGAVLVGPCDEVDVEPRGRLRRRRYLTPF